MRSGFLTLCLLLALQVVTVACSDDEKQGDTPTPPPTPENPIEFASGGIPAPVVEQEGGTATVSFTASDDWTAEVNAVTRAVDWVSVQPVSGPAGDATLTITTQPNDTYDERNAAIVLTCAGQQTTLTVTQKQQDALLVSSNKVELDAAGGSFTLTVQANVTVSSSIEEGASWLTNATTRALTEHTLAFEAAANDGTEPRRATITLTGGGLTEQVTVYQTGTAPVLVLGQREYLVGSEGEIIQVELQSNTGYEVQMPAVDWISEVDVRAASAYTLYYSVAPNDTYDNRSAQIVFTDTEHGLADTLTVTQLQRDAIVLAEDEYTLDGGEDTLSFLVQTNVEVTATADVDWITTLPATRALQEQELRFRIDALPDTTGRQGIITLTGGGATQQITVKQIYQESKLVRVEYRTGYTWEEAHDNLPLLYYATVYRDRYYENGEKVTDKFVDAGHMITLYPSTLSRPSIREYEALELQYILNASVQTVVNDSVTICNTSTVVPNPSALYTKVYQDEYLTAPAGTWDDYIISKLYDTNEFIAADTVPTNGNWETCSLETGWYFKDIRYRKTLQLLDGEHYDFYIDRYTQNLIVYDQFLVIDGRRIDFLQYQPEYHFNLKSENTSAGLVHTFECSFEFMGRNFYGALINTITQQ